MPKVRCRECETVLNAPEKARGKAIKCSNCGSKVKVPGESSGGKKPKTKAAEGDLFSGRMIDDYEMEHEDGQICPYCAAELDEEDPVCRSCGMNIETGKMDAKEKKRRSMKGPDPALFYKTVWSDSWAFLMQEKGLAVKTGTRWAIFATLHAMTAYLGFIYCERLPPKTFWSSLAVLTFLGLPGWYFLLGLKVIRSTYLNEQFRSDRLNVDMFTSMASGMRAVMWPVIITSPILVPLLLVLGFTNFDRLKAGDPTLVGIIAAVVLIPAVLTLPSAMVHMTARYSYKGWILWELLLILGGNFVSTLYFLLVVVIACIPPAIIAAPIFIWMKSPSPFTSEVILSMNDKIVNAIGIAGGSDTLSYAALKGPLNVLTTFVLFAPIAYVGGFSAIFLMRATGLFGYYNQRQLDLVESVAAGKPAPFWVRYLAHSIDVMLSPLSCFFVTAHDKALMIAWVFNGFLLLIYIFSRPLFLVGIALWLLYMLWLYWAVQESSQVRTTLGKDAFGLIVVTEKNGVVSMKDATMKFFLRLTFWTMLGLPFLMAAFSKDKRAMHDVITRTKVVFKGDK